MRSALKLINEWRDSISYTVTLAALFSVQTPVEAAGWFCVFAMLREWMRAVAWEKAPIVVGQRGGNREKCEAAAALGASSALCANGVIDIAAGNGGLATYFVLAVQPFGWVWPWMVLGRFEAAVPIYLDTMWDWPRKRDGGGETKRIADKIKAWAAGVSPSLTPVATRTSA